MLISNKQIKEMLSLHPEDKRELINSQVQQITDLIIENKKKYMSNTEYSDAIDSVLRLIMQGAFAEVIK